MATIEWAEAEQVSVEVETRSEWIEDDYGNKNDGPCLVLGDGGDGFYVIQGTRAELLTLLDEMRSAVKDPALDWAS